MFRPNRNQKGVKGKILDPDIDFSKAKSVHSISSWWGIGGIFIILFIGNLTSYTNSHLPDALRNAHLVKYPNAFIAERAYKDLKILNDFGPKPTGSYANEILAVDFLLREISYIDQLRNKNQHIAVDKQVVSGGYVGVYMNKSAASVYRNVQNVVVKLVGKKQDDALLLNCHFDSVANSPGASDDLSGCAVMLEILRVLSRQAERNRFSIIFLFNGAEETPLQASHGFITSHQWAKEVRAFINLESAGSGGKEMLFQSGPRNPWLIEMYAKAIMYPYAQAAAEEVFQSGVVPSDTDFRVFRDAGGIPGMDFAYTANGYRYHTTYDSIDYIPMAVLQRTGDNILSLTKAIANSENLANPHQKSEHTVYFDFLGLFFISYSAEVGLMINLSVVLLSIIIPFLSLARSTSGTHGKQIRSETVVGFVATLVGVVVSGLVCFFIGYQLDLIGRSMSWYSSTNLVLGVYCCPALLFQCLTHMLCSKILGSKTTPLSLALKVQARLNGVNLFWGMLTLGITFTGYRIAYIFMVLIFFSLLSNTLISMFGVQNSVHKWLYIHLLFQIFAILWSTQFYHMVLNLFIPITGRIGASINPDLIIGAMATCLTLLSTSYMTPLIFLLKKTDKLIGELVAITCIALLLASSTHIGFPYRDDSLKAPTVQRHYITHTLRTFHDYNGGVRYTDSGYLLQELDRNAKKTIEGIAMPDGITPMREIVTCEKELFCAIPFYSIWHQVLFENYWIPSPPPIIHTSVKCLLSGKDKISENEYRLQLTLHGDHQCALVIGPKAGASLVNWDLVDELPNPIEFNSQRGYFVLISSGLNPVPLNFTLHMRHEISNYDGPLVDLTVTTTFWEHQKQHTPVFNKLLARVPTWAHVVPSVAAVNSYIF
ncbi:endoplasmic reticulum metallopeptidase 1-like [Toxorhynchites rutilus septentrionalis]|uniref:endoplasmic reticulum metallopeptidase 1-like n=1 Tax=Toxorhynchites rutilus septentrionalis TaxID=329112 RepID=UPI002478B1B5|nr:endoplasmic reticulum metallopeptidase 1-like [Toxorhynchites rutilus septentrionalis]